MSGTEIEVEGLSDLIERFEQSARVCDNAARIAVNDTARFARRTAKKRITDNVRLKPSYLGGEKGRLGVRKFASNADLIAEVGGRDRPTSLARFGVGRPKFGRQRKGGVSVRVATNGGAQRIRKGFYMKLKRGATIDGQTFNVGLALRLKPGESPSGTVGAKSIGGGLWLLYGPSIDQVFENVADDDVGEYGIALQENFDRQWERLFNE